MITAYYHSCHMGSHEPYKADNPGKTDYGGSEYGNTASGQDSGALNAPALSSPPEEMILKAHAWL